jgi:hypothetical protein
MADPGGGCKEGTADGGDDWKTEPVGARIETLDQN